MSFDYERWKKAQFASMEEAIPSRVAFPPSITWAGMIWALTGVLTLGSVLVLSLQTGTIRTPGSILAGLLFLYGGLRATSGTTPGTFRSGIASIVLGVIWVCAGVLSTTWGFGSNGALLIISGGMGGAFILAGVLAVSGQPSYQKWRAAHAGGGSRSPRK
jgi:hypothetical protein